MTDSRVREALIKSRVYVAHHEHEAAAANDLLDEIDAALAREPGVSESVILAELQKPNNLFKIIGSKEVLAARLAALSHQQPAAEAQPPQDGFDVRSPVWPGNGGGDD